MKYIFSFLFLIPFLAKAQDTTAPVISNFWTQDTVFIGVFSDFVSQIPGYSIIDDVDADITAQAEIINEVNEDSLGYYNFTISAKDKAENSVSQSVVIHVVDTVAPRVELYGPKWNFVGFGEDFIDHGVGVSDNYYDNIHLTVIVGGTFENTWKQGRFCITYEAEDPSFNRSRVHFTVVCVELDSMECISLPGELCEDEGVRTGIDDIGSPEVAIYPTFSSCNFKIKGNFEKVTVYNITGQEALSTSKDHFHLTQKGTYLVKVLEPNGKIDLKKIYVVSQ